MKNQYFGDINDYKKYSLLRMLSGNGQLETSVCWALTHDDGKKDGGRIRYLEQPDKWRSYDPILFEYLRKHVLENDLRHVSLIEQPYVLPNCRFYSSIIQDDLDSRGDFFDKFIEFARGSDLIFFDPDNGLEVKSVPRGRKKSSKYIYWNEIKTLYEAGYSLLVYQHFPRKAREPFIRSLVPKFKVIHGARQVFSYCTFHVAFFLVPQPKHENIFFENSTKVSEKWGDIIMVRQHKLVKTRIVA